jgi:hypothetical protein
MKNILIFFFFFVFTKGAFIKTNVYRKKSDIEVIMGPNPVNINDHSYKLMDKILDIKLDDERNLGRVIVEKTSSLLPKVDTIGHKVLHANNEFISAVLNMDNLPHDLRKDIVLWSIKLAQYGDNMGSDMLQFYYDLVDRCL